EGRSLVAVSADGHAVASVGIDRTTHTPLPGAPSPTGPTPTLPGGVPQTLKLYVDEVPVGANFSAGPVSAMTVEIAGVRAAGLALSDDGSRAAVLVDDGLGNLTLLAYNVAPPNLNPAFTYAWAGKPEALAADATLSRILVGGDLLNANNETRASLIVVDYATGKPLSAYSEAANGSAVTGLAVTPDGALAAMGTNQGRLVTLNGRDASSPQAYQAAGPATNVSHVALSPDGTHVALAAEGTIHAYRLSGLLPSPLWTATEDAAVNSLSYNATGGILVASFSSGAASGAYAFGDGSATPIWSLPGEIFDIKVNDAGTEIAFRQGHVVDAQRLPRGFAFEQAGGGKASAVRPLRAGASAVFDLVVRATGAAPETVALSAAADPNLAVSFDPPVVTALPGTNAHVAVTLNSTPAFSGTHTVNLTATGLSTAGTDHATVSVSFEGVANVTFRVNQTEYQVTPGAPAEALLTVFNGGTSSAAVGLRYSQQPSVGPQWGLAVDPTSFLVPQGSITTVRVTVTPPASTANGTNDAVSFILEGPNVSDAVTLHFRVNPHLGVDVGALGRVKFVEPGKVAFFNVTVSNTGSISRAFSAFYDTTPANGKPWAVDMATDPFRLEPGASRTVPVKVFAPADATPDDHVAVLVRARSVPEEANETFVEANVTLFANAVQPQPTSTTTSSGGNVPFPGILALAACLALATLARRRRAPSVPP